MGVYKYKGNKNNNEDYFHACILANVTYTLYDPTDDQPEYIKNIDELEKLRVRFLASGNANESSGKTVMIDYVGVYIEYSGKTLTYELEVEAGSRKNLKFSFYCSKDLRNTL